MAVNGAQEPAASIVSFWDIEGFKRTLRRTEDGMSQCNELMKLMQERAEIEKEYAKRLHVWAKKWTEGIEKGSEYGTTKLALRGCVDSTSRLAEVHIAVKDRIVNAILVRIKDWKNENYKKQIVGGCREAKVFEEDFRKAQKPWQKKYTKVTKAKKDYFNACRQERAAAGQENSVRNAPEGPQTEQLRKAQEKTEKCRKEMDAAKQKYTAALLDLNAVNGKYMEDMTEVFERTQEFERRRLDFNKTILNEFHSALDFSKNPSYIEVYKQIRETVDQTDVSKDLIWWAQTHGTGMSMSWPAFEECPGDTVPVDRADNRMSASVSNGASLADAAAVGGGAMDVNAAYRSSTSSSGDLPQYASVRSNTSSSRDNATYRSSVAGYSDNSEYRQNTDVAPRPYNSVSQRSHESYSVRSSSITADNNPFDDQNNFTSTRHHEAESTRYENAADMHPASAAGSSTLYEEIPSQTSAGGGVTVRALYDYNAVEEDELNFKAGDIFLKIKDVDGQGWCTGLKDGHVGLYPESYAQPC